MVIIYETWIILRRTVFIWFIKKQWFWCIISLHNIKLSIIETIIQSYWLIIDHKRYFLSIYGKSDKKEDYFVLEKNKNNTMYCHVMYLPVNIRLSKYDVCDLFIVKAFANHNQTQQKYQWDYVKQFIMTMYIIYWYHLPDEYKIIRLHKFILLIMIFNTIHNRNNYTIDVIC